MIQTTPGGYRIAVDTEDLDLLRFERLLAAAVGVEPVREAAILRGALDLWRGPVVADVESRAVQAYDVPAIREWLVVFVKRFFGFAQFKRSAMPNGPKVSHGGSLSPRGDWRAPSDGNAAVWLADIEQNIPTS